MVQLFATFGGKERSKVKGEKNPTRIRINENPGTRKRIRLSMFILFEYD